MNTRLTQLAAASMGALMTLTAATAHADCAYGAQLADHSIPMEAAVKVWCADAPASQLRARYKRRNRLQDGAILALVFGGIATLGGSLGIFLSSGYSLFERDADPTGIGVSSGVAAVGVATMITGGVLLSKSNSELTQYPHGLPSPPPPLVSFQF